MITTTLTPAQIETVAERQKMGYEIGGKFGAFQYMHKTGKSSLQIDAEGWAKEIKFSSNKNQNEKSTY